jgi:uncharacterized protein YdaU (DUF1376 family)
MYYYQHHIGDYRRDTAHLSLLEHGVYRQLLDLYYITEKPLDANALRLICARDANEVDAVKQILSEFFTLEDGKYYHDRCEDEIAKFHSKSDKAKASAKARWNKNNELEDANALQTQSKGNANHKPLTNNHKPLKYIPPIPKELLDNWLIARKKKPVTKIVFDAISREAAVLGWSVEEAILYSCENSWQGFKAEWVSPADRNRKKLDDWLNEDSSYDDGFGSIKTIDVEGVPF